MLSFLYIPVLITAAVIIYQDLKSRTVIWIVFPVLWILGVIQNLTSLTPGIIVIKYLVTNTAFLIIQYILLMAFYYLKEKKVSIIDNKIGLGDILFLISCSAFFSPINFIVFYASSLLFTLIVYLALKIHFFKVNQSDTIPLAGLQSMFFILIVFAKILSLYNYTNDSFFLNSILHK